MGILLTKIFLRQRPFYNMDSEPALGKMRSTKTLDVIVWEDFEETLTQCWLRVGPSSALPAQHEASIE